VECKLSHPTLCRPSQVLEVRNDALCPFMSYIFNLLIVLQLGNIRRVLFART
jgi:hypothetical protein